LEDAFFGANGDFFSTTNKIKGETNEPRNEIHLRQNVTYPRAIFSKARNGNISTSFTADFTPHTSLKRIGATRAAQKKLCAKKGTRSLWGDRGSMLNFMFITIDHFF